MGRMYDAGFKPGDKRPQGYMAWHSWAEVQHKAGLRQARCSRCYLYNFPQELAQEEPPVCHECAAKAELEQE